MKKGNRCKGMMSFDALFSMLPIVLISIFVIQTISVVGNKVDSQMEQQDLFDKLVSIADYSVKTGLVKATDSIRYPNWIADEIDQIYIERLRMKTGLQRLSISLDEPGENYRICIYRLVVSGEEKQISRLFVCGD